MKTRNQKSRVSRFAMICAVALVMTSIAMMRFSSIAEGSGYNVVAGINGEVTCDPGGPDDCPGGGQQT